AKDLHPDKTGGDKSKETRFKEISEAYDTLSNAERRREYDEAREAAAHGGRPGAGAGFGGFGEGGGVPFDISDLLNRMRGGAGGFSSDARGGAAGRGRGGADIFGDVFAGAPGGFEDVYERGFPEQEEPGTVHAELEVDFADAAKGGTRTVTLDLERVCPECGGRGGRLERCAVCGGSGMRRTASGAGVQVAQTCPRCGGSGQTIDKACPRCGGRKVVATHDTLEVRIPAGVDTGSVIRLRGKGPARASRRGREEARAGDLLLRIKVRPDPRFRREGLDILAAVPLSLEEAILGARVEVPTIDGPARLRIPPGTPSGQRFRLRGKGAYKLGEQTRGDQYVRTEIVVPQNVDKQTAELVRELGRRAPVKLDR
ncbi:MAG TPA: DnaJ C-terminal domain-containing protein, partial [Polyangia bacterium]